MKCLSLMHGVARLSALAALAASTLLLLAETAAACPNAGVGFGSYGYRTGFAYTFALPFTPSYTVAVPVPTYQVQYVRQVPVTSYQAQVAAPTAVQAPAPCQDYAPTVSQAYGTPAATTYAQTYSPPVSTYDAGIGAPVYSALGSYFRTFYGATAFDYARSFVGGRFFGYGGVVRTRAFVPVAATVPAGVTVNVGAGGRGRVVERTVIRTRRR